MESRLSPKILIVDDDESVRSICRRGNSRRDTSPPDGSRGAGCFIRAGSFGPAAVPQESLHIERPAGHNQSVMTPHMQDVFSGADPSQLASVQLILTAQKIGFVAHAELEDSAQERFRFRIMVPEKDAGRAQKALWPLRELLFLAAEPV